MGPISHQHFRENSLSLRTSIVERWRFVLSPAMTVLSTELYRWLLGAVRGVNLVEPEESRRAVDGRICVASAWVTWWTGKLWVLAASISDGREGGVISGSTVVSSIDMGLLSVFPTPAAILIVSSSWSVGLATPSVSPCRSMPGSSVMISRA